MCVYIYISLCVYIYVYIYIYFVLLRLLLKRIGDALPSFSLLLFLPLRVDPRPSAASRSFSLSLSLPGSLSTPSRPYTLHSYRLLLRSGSLEDHFFDGAIGLLHFSGFVVLVDLLLKYEGLGFRGLGASEIRGYLIGVLVGPLIS